MRSRGQKEGGCGILLFISMIILFLVGEDYFLFFSLFSLFFLFVLSCFSYSPCCLVLVLVVRKSVVLVCILFSSLLSTSHTLYPYCFSLQSFVRKMLKSCRTSGLYTCAFR